MKWYTAFYGVPSLGCRHKWSYEDLETCIIDVIRSRLATTSSSIKAKTPVSRLLLRVIRPVFSTQRPQALLDLAEVLQAPLLDGDAEECHKKIAELKRQRQEAVVHDSWSALPVADIPTPGIWAYFQRSLWVSFKRSLWL